MTIINYLFKFLLAFLMFASTQINAQVSSTQLLQDNKKFSDYLVSMEKEMGFAEVLTASFTITKFKYSLTSPLRTIGEKGAPLYFAHVTPEKDGAALYFSVYRDCSVTSLSGKLAERVIKINEQKVVMHYFCARAPADNNKLKELYLFKNTQAKDFAYNEFSSKKYVFVDFDNVIIPFDTDGFLTTWKKADGPAL